MSKLDKPDITLVQGSVMVIEPSMHTRTVLLETLHAYDVLLAVDAEAAIHMLSDNPQCKVVIVDISLAGHSGFEFLYELRTYRDWDDISAIVYSSIELDHDILQSRAWQKLMVFRYFYKPQARLDELAAAVEAAIGS